MWEKEKSLQGTSLMQVIVAALNEENGTGLNEIRMESAVTVPAICSLSSYRLYSFAKFEYFVCGNFIAVFGADEKW